MTAIVPGSAQSTQWAPAGKPCLSSGVVSEAGREEEDFGMNLKVEARAIILGLVSFRPIVGEKGTVRYISVRYCLFLLTRRVNDLPKSAR